MIYYIIYLKDIQKASVASVGCISEASYTFLNFKHFGA